MGPSRYVTGASAGSGPGIAVRGVVVGERVSLLAGTHQLYLSSKSLLASKCFKTFPRAERYTLLSSDAW